MINYAKHDEEFYGIFKLISGEEVLGKAVLTEDHDETLAFLQNPVALQIIHRDLDDEKVSRGIGFAKWQQLSDDDFFILREKDIISVSTMSKAVVLMYEAFIMTDEGGGTEKKSSVQTDPDRSSGYLGAIDDTRRLLEKIFKNPGHQH